MKNYLVIDTKAAIVDKIRENMKKDEEVRRFWEEVEVKMVFPDDDKEKRHLLVKMLTHPNFSKKLVKEIKKLMGNDATKCQIDIWGIEPKKFFPTLKQRCFKAVARKSSQISKIKAGNCEVTLAKVSKEEMAMAIIYYR